MDLTPEEKEGLRELLAGIRQVGEDFAHVFANRMLIVSPDRRLALRVALDGGETLLSSFADSVASLFDREWLSAALGLLDDRAQQSAFREGFDFRVECFQWAADRCLGSAFTSQARSAHRKLAMITRAAVMSGKGRS